MATVCDEEPWMKVRGHMAASQNAMTDNDAKPKRPSPIPYRPPNGRKEELRMRAAASGLSMNAYITACIFGRSRHRSTATLLSDMLDRTAEIADLLHELSIAGAADAQVLEAAQDELAELRAALFAVLGRKP